jgi:hypothetical protein
MEILKNPLWKRIVADAVEWTARLERLARLPKYSIERLTSRQTELPSGAASVIASAEAE